ncbi:DUF2306 domain-containing protein [Janibacter cremeus]|uniref:DUF2306 domain-containing protein n=1 Tax=Janibacter cremeus TaxID=1285192 RepID=UPI0023FA18EE|nr:DUF2306 domain-containing protein [Janibacter cremeus]WEV79444.1 DUF2306 domain-containing protein [Janibacter cremeus]
MTPLLVSHLLAALIALPLGGYQLFRPTKGDPRHVLLGHLWVALMVWVAISSFWLRDLNHGEFSLLHILSVVTLVSVALGVLAARRGNIPAHKGSMRGSWLGLCGAFVGAVAVPDRTIPTFVVTRPVDAVIASVLLVATTVLLIRIGDLLTRRAPLDVGEPRAARSGARGH